MYRNNDELIEKLSILTLEESSIRRCIEKFFYDDTKKAKLFKRLKEVVEEKKKLKFEIRLRREMKNEK